MTKLYIQNLICYDMNMDNNVMNMDIDSHFMPRLNQNNWIYMNIFVINPYYLKTLS